MPPDPLRLCAPKIVRRAQIVLSAQIVRRAQIVRCAETEPPSTMMLSHFSGGNPAFSSFFKWFHISLRDFCRRSLLYVVHT